MTETHLRATGKSAFRAWLPIGALMLGLALALAAVLGPRVWRARPEPRPAGEQLAAPVSSIPQFSLKDQSNQAFGTAELKGKVWVAGFIFTRCHQTCPRVSAALAGLAEKLPAEVPLVSFSVDPRYDSPEVLAQYASNFKADPQRWHFLTGPRDDVYRVIRDGFRVSVEENPDPRSIPGELISHTTRLAVVDGTGAVRGYFESGDPVALAELQRLVRKLIQ